MYKRGVYLLVLISLVQTVFGQTVHELEQKLYWHPGDKEVDQMAIARKILKLDTLNKNAIEFICHNYWDKEVDSVNIFLDNLIAKYPSNTGIVSLEG